MYGYGAGMSNYTPTARAEVCGGWMMADGMADGTRPNDRPLSAGLLQGPFAIKSGALDQEPAWALIWSSVLGWLHLDQRRDS